MGLKRYDVEVGGRPTTLQLSDEDAKRMGLLGKEAKAPANKEAKAPANKARGASNKRAEAAAQAFGGDKQS